jgi:hypothetical protein
LQISLRKKAKNRNKWTLKRPAKKQFGTIKCKPKRALHVKGHGLEKKRLELLDLAHVNHQNRPG